MSEKKVMLLLIVVTAVIAVCVFIWYSNSAQKPEQAYRVLFEYHSFLSDVMESDYLFKRESTKYTFDSYKSDHKKKSEILYKKVRKLLYKPGEYKAVFLTYYKGELDKIGYAQVVDYWARGGKTCGIATRILEYNSEEDHLIMLVKSSCKDGIQIIRELQEPRRYYLKKTLFGWKIDWLKSMADIVNN